MTVEERAAFAPPEQPLNHGVAGVVKFDGQDHLAGRARVERRGVRVPAVSFHTVAEAAVLILIIGQRPHHRGLASTFKVILKTRQVKGPGVAVDKGPGFLKGLGHDVVPPYGIRRLHGWPYARITVCTDYRMHGCCMLIIT